MPRLEIRYVAARQLKDASWRFAAGAAHEDREVEDPLLARRFDMLSDAIRAAHRMGGEALPWALAVQLAHSAQDALALVGEGC